MNKKVLIFTPHADDSELGMGGTISKHHNDGDKVYTVLVADHKLMERAEQFVDACNVLGAKPIIASSMGFLFRDGHIGDDTERLVTFMDKMKNIFKPDLVYLPFPSVHQDHCAVYEAGVRMARLSLNEKEWFIPSVLVYNEPVSKTLIYDPGLEFNIYSDISGEHIKNKMEAIKAHKSEILQYPHPSSPEYLEYEARTEGGECGVEHAEVFASVRLMI